MKIIHLADLHLGYKAYNRLNEHGFNVRELDVIETFRESLRKIVELKPDLIIMAGDVFHKPRPSNLTIFQTIKRLSIFRNHCKAPIIIVSGNHESVKAVESGNVLNILESVIPDLHVIDGSIKEIEFKELDTLFVGIPYNALHNFKIYKLAPDKAYKYNILSIHGSYDSIKCPELTAYNNDYLIKAKDIKQPEWDYIAFGHYHKYTELASNTYYSGSIERTSNNIWQEANDPKGFIEYNPDNKEIIFHKLETPRKVFDIKGVNAENLSAEEVDKLIEEKILKIKNFNESIVRLTVENIDSLTVRNLDYKKIREYKKNAVHFRINFIKKDSILLTDSSGEPIEKKKTLLEYIDEEITNFDLYQGLDKDKFSNLAKEYLVSEINKCD